MSKRLLFEKGSLLRALLLYFVMGGLHIALRLVNYPR